MPPAPPAISATFPLNVFSIMIAPVLSSALLQYQPQIAHQSTGMVLPQTFGGHACHPERSDGSGETAAQIQSSRSESALERHEGQTGRTPRKPAHGSLLSEGLLLAPSRSARK